MRGITEERLKEMINIGWRADYETILEECKELNTWMPIESAPKDRRILLFYPDVGLQIGFWNVNFKDYSGAYLSQCSPTHWQELPEDPK